MESITTDSGYILHYKIVDHDAIDMSIDFQLVWIGYAGDIAEIQKVC